MSNIVKAVFGSSKMTTTRPLWQYDHGMVLQFIGVNLPTAYQVHFANSESGTAKTALGNADGVEIIDEYFLPGNDIYAWVYVNEGDSGHTVYVARIPVLKKALPTDQQPTPVQQTAIENAIDALNEAAEEVPLAINTALAEAKASGEFDGDPGEDGYSPTVTVADISGGHRVTITDVNGDHTFDVMDGQGGSGGGAVSSVNGETGDVVLDASDVGALPDNTAYVSSVNGSTGDVTVTVPTKTSELQNDSGYITSAPVTSVNSKTGAVALTASDVGAGTYSKPSGGIPKTDLASAVQTSLGKADTAYQKPSGGIPGTDLASGVVPQLFEITCTPTALDYSGTMNKTPQEIAAAYARGDRIVATITNVATAELAIANTGGSFVFWAFAGTILVVMTTSINLSKYSTQLFDLATDNTLGNSGQPADAYATGVAIAAKLDANQGSSNAGKFLVVGNDGAVAPVTMSAWQGGNY